MASVMLFFLINLFSVSRDSFTAGGLLTSSSVTEGVPKDSQPSLDLASATSGDKIVTAQVLGNGWECDWNIFYCFSDTVEIM